LHSHGSSQLQKAEFTESQNHRTIGVGRGFCGSSSPTLLPKQGHLNHVAKDLLLEGLEYLQRRSILIQGYPPGFRVLLLLAAVRKL